MNPKSKTPANYEAWLMEPLWGKEIPKETLLRNLVGWAILAASTHNTQPWRFIINPKENRIDGCLNSAFILPESDRKGRQATLSIGCALQNLLLAADYYGLAYSVDFSRDLLVYPEPIFSIGFNEVSEIGQGNTTLLDAMRTRSMNRHQYDPLRPVPPNVLDQIQDEVQKMGLAANVITDMPTILAIASFQFGADSTVIMRTKFRNELADFFLPNDTTLGRGMPGNTFGFNNATTLAVKKELQKSGPVNPGQMAGFSRSSRDGIQSSPALFVISVKEDTPQWWLKAGMAFQKIAVIAELNDLSVSVHAATVEVEMASKTLSLRLGRNERPTMVFRMGYAREKMPHSPRVPVEEVTEVKDD